MKWATRRYSTEDLSFYSEDLSHWRNFHGSNMLGLFYADRKKYGHSFQSLAQLTFLKKMLHPQNANVALAERSFLTQFEVFVRTQYKAGVCYFVLTNLYMFVLICV